MDIKNAPFIKEIRDLASNMYRLGWNERNGGNISVLLKDSEMVMYKYALRPIRTLSLSLPFPELAGRYFVVTGTGKYFKNINGDPETNLGLVRISNDGTCSELMWGFKDGGTYTSEIAMHLGAHVERLKRDPNHRVIVHAHPANTVAMTHIHSWDEKEFTLSLWNMITECIVIFPEGVGLLPWMVSSGPDIGRASREKFMSYRMLVWALHGITAAGNSLDEAFGLIETVEKAAEIYMKICNTPNRTSIDKNKLKDVVRAFNLKAHEGWLD